MVNVTINGKQYQVEPGTSVIEACKQNGIKVPYYCYHKNLSVAGNCRMCLVKIEKLPKLAIACATPVNEGMVVDTQAPEVLKARESIMEFQLINHPLDCPVCDQAGECKLQNYSYDHGRPIGRFKDEKVVKHTKDFGDHVKYWGSRCILCTRCVRFTEEISGTQELAVFNRGDHSEIDIFPGNEINNPLSMNVVDICPVGALVSSDFLYQARVWFMERKESICLECSVGCNIRIDSLNNEIKRIVPRDNQDVNQVFMCDHGRLNFGYIQSENRVKYPMSNGKIISWKEGIGLLSNIINGHSNNNTSNKVSILVSAWNSNETLYMVHKLQKNYLKESLVLFYSKEKTNDQIFAKFRISGDKNPNTMGIKTIFNNVHDISEKSINQLINQALSNSIDTLILIGGIPNDSIPNKLKEIFDNVKTIILLEHSQNALSEKAFLSLPTLTFAEKSGSYINDQKRIQRIFPAVEPITSGKSEDHIIQEVIISLGGAEKVLSSSGVFDEMKSIPAFKNINYRSIKNRGTLLNI